MSWIEIVRQSVTMRDALNHYIGNPSRMGKYLCPFHQDKNPSLSINPRTDKFRCFSCGAAGDVIDFVQNLFNVPQKEALEILGRDFNLGLEGKREDREAVRRAKQKREDEKRQQEELALRIQTQLKVLWDYRQIMWDGYHRTAPKSSNEMSQLRNDNDRANQCIWFYYQSEWLQWLINCLQETEYNYDLADCPFYFDALVLGEDPHKFACNAKKTDLERRKNKTLNKLEKGEIEPICRATNLHITTSA